MHPSSICSCVCVKIYRVIDILPFFLLVLHFPILSSFARPSALIVYAQSAYCSHAQVIVYAQYIHYRLFMHNTFITDCLCTIHSLYDCFFIIDCLCTVCSLCPPSVLNVHAQSVYCSLCISTHSLRTVCILFPLYQYSFFTHSLYTDISLSVLNVYAVCIQIFLYQY